MVHGFKDFYKNNFFKDISAAVKPLQDHFKMMEQINRSAIPQVSCLPESVKKICRKNEFTGYINLKDFGIDLKNLTAFEPKLLIDYLPRTHINDLNNNIIKAQISFSALQKIDMDAFNRGALFERALFSSLNKYFVSYENLNQSVVKNMELIPKEYSEITLTHSQEAIITGNLAVKLFDGNYENDEIQGQIETDIKYFSTENKEHLKSLLMELNPDFYNITWKGADQSLQGNNIDKCRHVMTSLRELITHVLHQLAPNDDIRRWSNDESLFDDKGNPKRRSRILYITRGVTQKDLSKHLVKYYENDISLILDFVDVLNKGTHKIKSELSDIELKSIMIRTESLLIALIKQSKIKG